MKHMTHRRLFRRDTSGATAVETAFVVGLVVLPTLLCLMDFIVVYRAQAIVDVAVEDAMTYVMNAGGGATAAGVQAAAQAASGTSVSVSTATVCTCASSTSATPTLPSTVTCTSTCASGTATPTSTGAAPASSSVLMC